MPKSVKEAISGMLDAKSGLKKAKLRDSIGKNMSVEEEASYGVIAPLKQRTKKSSGEKAIESNTKSAKSILKVDDFSNAVDMVRKKKSSKSSSYQ